MRAGCRIAVVFFVFALASCARDLQVGLSVSVDEKKKQIPVFTVSVRNVSKSSLVVLDPRRYVPSVSVGLFPFPDQSICDPIGPEKNDYITLSPGEALTAKVDSEMLCYGPLHPGTYFAVAEYWNLNYDSDISDRYSSNTVSFVIRK